MKRLSKSIDNSEYKNFQSLTCNSSFISSWIFIQHTQVEPLENDLSNDILIHILGNIVSKILVKNRKLLTLVIQGAVVYKKTSRSVFSRI